MQGIWRKTDEGVRNGANRLKGEGGDGNWRKQMSVSESVGHCAIESLFDKTFGMMCNNHGPRNGGKRLFYVPTQGTSLTVSACRHIHVQHTYYTYFPFL